MRHTRCYAAALLLTISAIAPVRATPLDDAYTAWQAGELETADTILSGLLRDTPNDANVHFLYGQVALARGKTSHAAFAFERVLDHNPDNQRARLELARAYYLLGQYEAAQALFLDVLATEPPPQVEANITDFLQSIKQQTRLWQVSGQISLAAFHDDNVNYGPAENEIDTRLGRLIVNDDARPASAWGIALSGDAQLRYDPGLRDAWQWTLGGTAYRSWLDDHESQEIVYGQIQAGLQHIGLRQIARWTAATDRLRYGDEDLLDTHALGFTLHNAWSAHWITQLALQAEHRDFLESQERDSDYIEGRLTLQRLLQHGRHQLYATVGGFDEASDIDGYANQGWLLRLGGEASLPARTTAYAALHLRWTDHDGILLSALQDQARSDEQWQALLGLRHQWRPDVALDLQYRYVDNQSNFGLYEYTRNMITLSSSVTF
jgi:tetratricopeptide (TPR) repeat protein